MALADEFKIDADRLSSLGRFVNSPSVDEASIRPAPGSKKAEDVFIANVGIFFKEKRQSDLFSLLFWTGCLGGIWHWETLKNSTHSW